jgi:DegV family protein with EDD domain
MTVRIVTDSTCDLPAELIRNYNVAVVPLYINFGKKEYRDGIDMTRAEFYKRLPDFKPAPTTAAPGPDVFRKIYERLAAEGATEILSIHVSEKLSATVTIAAQAAKETTAVPVTVFDSRQLSLGTGFEVLAAAQAAADGRSVQEILSMLEEQISRTYVFAALDTLEFLRRSGRMNFALSFLGTLLQIKPFMKMYDGKPTAERIRTRNGAVNRLIELLKEIGPSEKVALVHTNAEDRARALLHKVKDLLPDKSTNIPIEEITPVIGAHVGTGVLGFVCISKNYRRPI